MIPGESRLICLDTRCSWSMLFVFKDQNVHDIVVSALLFRFKHQQKASFWKASFFQKARAFKSAFFFFFHWALLHPFYGCLHILHVVPGDDLNIKVGGKPRNQAFKQLPSVSWSHQASLYGIKKGLCLTEGVYILYLYRDSACVGFLWSIYFSRNELVKWSYIFSLCVPLQLWRELETVCSDIKLEIGKKDPFKHAEMCLLIEAWYVPYYEGILQTLLLQIAPFPFAPGMGYTSYYCRWLYGVQGSDRS